MDIIIFFNTLFGFFTLISWLISGVILYLVISKKKFNKLITDQFYNYATAVAVFSTAGSVIYSEVVGFIPCKFCWYQRYLMYPIALVLILGFFNKQIYRLSYIQRYLMYPIARVLILGFFNKQIYRLSYISFIGFFIGLYHVYLQNGGGGGGSCAIDVPCNLKYVDIFGFISIPVMAASAFLSIFLSVLYYDLSRKEKVE